MSEEVSVSSNAVSAVVESSLENSTLNDTLSIAQSLRELTDEELIKVVDDLEFEVLHLDLENQIFQHFLILNDPALLTGMTQVLEVAGKLQSRTQNNLMPPSERRDTAESIMSSSRQTESLLKFSTSGATEKGLRVNLSQKMELVMREMEEIQLKLEKFKTVSHKIRCDLKAEIEEIEIRESEVTEATEIFHQRIVVEGVNALTQRIPAEKFIRYMEEWLKSAESTIEKMRLRTNTLKSLYTKIVSQLIQKEELGESIDAADFDQLQIENKHLAETIEIKNTHLLDLKKTNGTANLVLSTNKTYLQNQVKELTNIREEIKDKEQKIIELDKESEIVEKSVAKVRNNYQNVLNILTTYQAPNVLEYVKAKASLDNVKKKSKILQRRNHIDRFALNTGIRQMKNLTGLKFPHVSWFTIETEETTDSFDDELISMSSKNSRSSSVDNFTN